MNYFIFDTETTGLTSKDEVIQFCGMLVDESLNKCKAFYDFYCMSTVPVHPDAKAIHHLDLDMIRRLSDGKFFEERFLPLSKQFPKDCMFIQYSNGFDTRMVNQTLEHANLPHYDFGETVTSIKPIRGITNYNAMVGVAKALGLKGRIALQRALKSLPNFNEEFFKKQYSDFNLRLSKSGVDMPANDVLAHNARYDTFCTWYLLRELRGKIV